MTNPTPTTTGQRTEGEYVELVRDVVDLIAAFDGDGINAPTRGPGALGAELRAIVAAEPNPAERHILLIVFAEYLENLALSARLISAINDVSVAAEVTE